MSSRLYDTFREMLEDLPVKAIVRAADAERRMVQYDLQMKRTPLDEDSLSVLGFCNFLVNAARGLRLSIPIWPTEHCEFYRAVVQRLIEAGELPPDLRDRMERCTAESSGRR